MDDRDGAPLRRPQVEALLADAHEGATRMRDVVRDLLLSRHDVDTLVAVDVRKVLESCLRLAQSDIRLAGRLVLTLDDVPPIRGNATRLGQVFLNLLINATQAIPPGSSEANEIRVATRTAPSGDVVVEVSDSGSGIPTEILGHIFDPFFTTKPVGVGTGLGLSICHGIVTGMNGNIDVESGDGGTTFRVTLPPGPPAVASVPEPRRPRQPTPRGRVLVIDDTEAMGATLHVVLDSSFDVTAVTRAKDALELIARGEAFDMILCDVMMPDMSGIELFERLSSEAPSIAARIVFMTGGASAEATRAFLDRVPNDWLEKPFESAALFELLGKKMAGR